MQFSQKAYLLGFLATVSLLLMGLYLQYQMGLEPCPLCIMQRVVFMAIGIICLFGFIIKSNWFQKLASGIMFLLAAIGAGIAGRQVWLQSLPADQVPVCGPGFDYMINNFPLGKALSMILTGSGECAEVQWRFLGLSIPGWSLVMFTGFMLAALYILFSKKPLRPDSRLSNLG